MAKEHITSVDLTDHSFAWTTIQKAAPDAVAGSGAVLFDDETREGDDEAISKAVSATEGGPSGGVTLGLRSDDLLFRVADLPAADDDELRGMVDLQIDKFSPFPVESMVVSHEVLRQSESSRLVLVAAARRERVDRVGDLLLAAGLEPVRVDGLLLGRLRVLRDAGEVLTEGRDIIILLEEESAELVATEDGIPVALRSLGAVQDLDPVALAAEVGQEVSTTLMTLELEHGPVEAQRIVVWQAGDRESVVADRLREEHACEVQVRDITELPSACEGVARRSLAPRGLLDLTPETWRARGQALVFKQRMLWTAGALAAIWLACVGVVFVWLQLSTRRVSALEARRDVLSGPVAEVKELRHRIRTIRRYTDRDNAALESLRRVCNVLPQGVLLSSFTYRKAESLRMAGAARAADQVYEFKSALDELGISDDITLNGPRKLKGKETFDVEIVLPGGEE